MTSANEAAASVRPTPAKIDALIAEYSAAQQTAIAARTAAQVAQGSADELKARVVDLVLEFGNKHSEASTKLQGARHKALVTVGRRMTTDAAAVDAFRSGLEEAEIPEAIETLFVKHVTYTLVGSPSELLEKLPLRKRVFTKLKGLLSDCFKITTNAPSLKVELAEMEKAA